MNNVNTEIGDPIVTISYKKINLKEDTFERFYEYISEIAHERKGRFTADEAINAMLDCVQRERSRKK
jgi:hypothetical protein